MGQQSKEPALYGTHLPARVLFHHFQAPGHPIMARWPTASPLGQSRYMEGSQCGPGLLFTFSSPLPGEGGEEEKRRRQVCKGKDMPRVNIRDRQDCFCSDREIRLSLSDGSLVGGARGCNQVPHPGALGNVLHGRAFSVTNPASPAQG